MLESKERELPSVNLCVPALGGAIYPQWRDSFSDFCRIFSKSVTGWKTVGTPEGGNNVIAEARVFMMRRLLGHVMKYVLED